MGTTPGITAAVPLVSVLEFKAHPTYLDLQNLRSGDSVGIDQDQELRNILLMASSRAEDFCRQPLFAHIQSDNDRLRPDRNGRLFLHPTHIPVRRLISYQYTTQIGQNQASITTPVYVLEDNRQIIAQLGSSGMTWSGSLQLGVPPTSTELAVTFNYVAGYGCSVLAADVAQAAMSITLADPTGLEPGDVVRIWDPGKEEAVVVSTSYTPNPVYPPVQTAVPLAVGTRFAHSAGLATGQTAEVTCSTLPPSVKTAVIYYAIDILQRPGSAGSQWPGAKNQMTTGQKKMPHSIWEEKAERILSIYQGVR